MSGWDDDEEDAAASDAADSFNDPESDAVGEAEEDLREHKAEYQPITRAAAGRLMEEVVQDVSSVLESSPSIAAALLLASGWNKERAVSNYLERRQAILKEVGLATAVAPSAAPSAATAETLCAICDEKYARAKGFALPACGHWFCKPCWCDYLEDKLREGKPALRTTCPQFKCPALVTWDAFRALVSEIAQKKYEALLLQSYVEDGALLKWCPAPRCDLIIRCFNPNVLSVKCACGNAFCFKCGEEAHEPVKCAMLQMWLEKCRNESETAHWIIANTRKCPKCLVRIEKSQGCNHMTCRACKHEFCWVCLGPWSEHGNSTGGFYKCNKFDPKKKPDKMTQEEMAKAELDRYLHYYQRFHNHDQSGRFAAHQAALTEQRMLELQSRKDVSWIDVQFLKAATDQVAECRRVLKYTYALGYYLPVGREKDLFEFLQQELEKTTEHLSELSERDLEHIKREEVANYTRVTQTFLRNLLDGVAGGLTDGGVAPAPAPVPPAAAAAAQAPAAPAPATSSSISKPAPAPAKR